MEQSSSEANSYSCVQNCIIFFVLYDYEAWAATLREEYRPWVFKNRLLRKKFDYPSWMKTVALGDSEFILLAKYYHGDQIKEIEMGRACGVHGGK